MLDVAPATHTVNRRFTPAPVLFTTPSALNGRLKYPSVGPLLLEAIAAAEIADKAVALGSLAGAATTEVSEVAGGYVQGYQGCDIYFSAATGAHEVHGDIRLKYNALQGPMGVLGLPTSDETGIPDGRGRFNQFVGGALYWTLNTGPMMLRGAILDDWGTLGRRSRDEPGPLGYPTQDEYRMATISPSQDPAIYWSLFENGAILSSKDGTAEAVYAQITPDVLRRVVRKTFDDAFHQPNADGSNKNIGLQPEVDTVAISTCSYGFWKSGPRKITFRLHGFHDNGLLPDTNFTLDVRLMFDTFWPSSFTEPTTKSIAVGLDWVSCTAKGLGSDSVSEGVADGVFGQFFRNGTPDPTAPWVPSGWVWFADIPTGADLNGANIDVLGIFLASDGSLKVILNPEPVTPVNFGQLRQKMAQARIDALTGN